MCVFVLSNISSTHTYSQPNTYKQKQSLLEEALVPLNQVVPGLLDGVEEPLQDVLALLKDLQTHNMCRCVTLHNTLGYTSNMHAQ
jgi:hypothetical protein